MRRWADAAGKSRRLTHRITDAVVRLWSRQNDYSGASAVLTAVLALTLLIDLSLGHLHLDRLTALLGLTAFAVLSVLPLVAGKRYPRWAGLAAVGVLVLWSANFVFRTTHAHSELSAFIEVTMVALYLGWFYRPVLARSALAFNLVLLLIAILLRPEPESSGYSTWVALAYASLISFFCLEAGSYLRRRALARANYDPLTGVLNRRGLRLRGASAIRAAQRSGSPLTAAVVDFDDFKALNDAGGHAAGDAALCATAQAWSLGLGPRDLVARIGGDEFLLLIHADRAAAHARLREIASAAPYAWTWGLTQVRPTDSLDDVMSRADGRMYDSKELRDRDPSE